MIISLVTGIIFVCLFDGFNTTFNNISAISWLSVLLVQETGGPRENHRPVASHWQTSSQMLYTSPWSWFVFTTSVVIGTDCIGSCKSNYHTIRTTTDPVYNVVIFYDIYRSCKLLYNKLNAAQLTRCPTLVKCKLSKINNERMEILCTVNLFVFTMSVLFPNWTCQTGTK